MSYDDNESSDIQVRGNYIFFWGSWLSNWALFDFTVDMVKYNCNEQYFMAEKARTFKDDDSLKKILDTRYPRAQKALGSKVAGYDDKIWGEKRYAVMVKGLTAKFRQNTHILDRLLSMKGTFVEASPYDTYWGVGLASDDPLINDAKNWRGQNMLGKALTEVRDLLLKEEGL